MCFVMAGHVRVGLNARPGRRYQVGVSIAGGGGCGGPRRSRTRNVRPTRTIAMMLAPTDWVADRAAASYESTFPLDHATNGRVPRVKAMITSAVSTAARVKVSACAERTR